MSDITLITGGCRSGKSGYAQNLAESYGGNKLYIATAPVFDDEMQCRVERHKAERAGRGWDTVEEQCQLSNIAAELVDNTDRYSAILVDCLTLWVNNLMFFSEKNKQALSEDDVSRLTGEMLEKFSTLDIPVIMVTNETGMGIVPENREARRFRDLAGRCNQKVAQYASKVVLMVCGQPLIIKNVLAKK